MHKNGLQVAVDGPASAGKSTVSKLVAKRFNYIYCDTGAMYRAITLKALDAGLNLSDEENILKLLKKTNITFKPGEPEQKVFIDGKEVTQAIRSELVTNNVSEVSALPEIRKELVKRQEKLADEGGIVMDGRDIGTCVLPNAEVKIFLEASVATRAERRFKENQEKGMDVNLETLKHDIEARDYKDSHRKVSPLKRANDAKIIDTSHMTILQVVDAISSEIEKKQTK